MEILVEGQLDYFEERSWKKRYFVMKYEISSALRYIEIYKDKHWQKQLPRHVVNLHPGYNVQRTEDPKKKHCFSVKTTDHVLLLASEDESVVTKWMITLEEYNLVKSFCVQPQDTPTMLKIEAVFPCHLQLVHSEVRLVSAMDGKLLGLWPFKCIRRYKFVGNLFSIEAGRKAPTGEGVFEFISNECSEIYRVMDTIIRTKAGNTTMRRLASEKLHNQIEQGQHHPVRKTNSVPVTPSLAVKAEPRYDYAKPINTTPMSRPPPPPIPLPEFPPPSNTDTTYDILSPGAGSPVSDFEATYCKPEDGTATKDTEYNTLEFATARTVDTRAPAISGSPGSYDTLRFTSDSASNGHELPKAKGNYDTLNFGAKFEKRDNYSSIENEPATEAANELHHSSGSFYDTLDHSSGSIGSNTGVPLSSNTYDSLDVGKRPPSGGTETYDSLGNTQAEVKPPSSLDLANNTYDTMLPAGKSTSPQGTPPPKPIAPVRPPPRKKVQTTPTKPEAAVRKISAGGKPVKPVRKNAPTKETREEPKSKPETMSEVIQKRLAMPQQPVDDGNYATVDHEYDSVDYSKVSTKTEMTPSSVIYAEPDEADGRRAVAPSVQKPAKPAKNHPKPVKNLFRKPPGPKPKHDAEGNFANELKKKLEIKLKKSGGHKAATSHTGQSGNDQIYDEVDYSSAPTYSEPFEANEANV